jgi:hypothetical protein
MPMNATKVIFVCGLPRSGTSCVAGILYHLGIPMGCNGHRRNRLNPQGYFEDPRLFRIANKSLENIWDTKRRNTKFERIALFTKWLRVRSTGEVIGGKYPRLSACIPDMHAAIPGLRIIKTCRDTFDVARSMRKAWERNIDAQALARRLSEADKRIMYDIDRLAIPCLEISYATLIAEAKNTVDSIIGFVEITPSQEQLKAAIASINPNLNHFTTV